ncbi:glucuronate isomerase [Planctomycetota bacterium]|nr:glucuronate isomerase [Planctomycetota bacterium]
MDRYTISQILQPIIDQTPIIDLHTHTFSPAFGDSQNANTPLAENGGGLLWGVDELVTYHYLIAELFRVISPDQLTPDQFYNLPKTEQADLIWSELFIKRTPISEACRGVITTLHKLGLDPNTSTLTPIRNWFKEQNASDFVDRVMSIANVNLIVMTNEVFDPHEQQLWLAQPEKLKQDSRFRAVLRVDALLNDWPSVQKSLQNLGYSVTSEFNQSCIDPIKQFLTDWIARMDPLYIATSFSPDFVYPSNSHDTSSQPHIRDTIIDQALMPILKDHNLPWALMIGSKRHINPALRSAGDTCAKADVQTVANLAANYPQNKFLITMLSRENQHELCVVARKFGNLLPFGCWWFLNNPSIIEEMTRQRIELLGSSFVPQHSDARILDQLIYKWDHSRKIISKVLLDKYTDLAASGWHITESQIQSDVNRFFHQNFKDFVGL